MKRYLASLFLASCAQPMLSQEPESCPIPYTEPPRAVVAEVVPTPEKPLFLVPAQSLFEKDPNNFDDATSVDQCELFGGKLSLSMSSAAGDLGRSYAIPCEGAGAAFTCEGTLWPLSVYREAAPEPDSGIKISLKVQERAGRYWLSGEINERSLQHQSCMEFSW